MPAWINEPFSGGAVTSRDRALLSDGELQEAIGCWYKPADQQRLHFLRGRREFADTGSGLPIVGLNVCQFDDGSDRVVALSGSRLYASIPGTTGSFSAVKTGLSLGAASLSATHYNDRWYLADGVNAPLVVEGGGVVRNMGMQSQDGAPTLTVGVGTGNIIRPAAPSSGLSDASKAVDSDKATFGYISSAGVGTKTTTFTGGGWTGSATTRQLNIAWSLGVVDSGTTYDNPYSSDDGFLVTVKFEYANSVDGNGDPVYTTIMEVVTLNIRSLSTFQFATADDPDNIYVRASLIYHAGVTAAVLRIYDIGLQQGSAAAAVNATLIYAIAEFDESRGLESIIGPTSTATLVAASGHNQVTITLPTTAKNSNATLWHIYRTADGGLAPSQLGLVGTAMISATSFIDTLERFPVTTQPTEVYPLLEARAGDGVLRFHQNLPPPLLNRIVSFRGMLVGLRDRSIRYTLPAYPESWPTIYSIDAIPLEEHDTLQDAVSLGNLLVLGATGAMLRVEELPQLINGSYQPGYAEAIRGAPGCVGPKALTAVPMGGESRAAWISPYGVYVTNGYAVQRISDDMDWSVFDGVDQSGWALHWDPDRFVLVMAYATAGTTNNRYAILHLHPSQVKEAGARMTWGHYGSMTDLAHAQVTFQRRLYSGHANGKVYTEDYGATDESNSYNSSGDLYVRVRGRRLYTTQSEFSVLSARIGHTDIGAARATVTWLSGRDSSGNEQSRVQNVTLAGHRWTLFDVARGGEWHEPLVEFTGQANGAFTGLQFQVRPLGRAGKVSVG